MKKENELTLNVFDIFESINGEVCLPGQGSLATFIRLAGCNLHCSYCDAKPAQIMSTGTKMTISQIFEKVRTFGNDNITITGGEPLVQKTALKNLVKALSDNGYAISIETNGSIMIPDWEDPSWVVDWKLPCSGEVEKMKVAHFKNLSLSDCVKFVISTRDDFDQAVGVATKILKTISLRSESGFFPQFAFSPCFGPNCVSAATLIEWMLADKWVKKHKVVMSYQIHKIIGVA